MTTPTTPAPSAFDLLSQGATKPSETPPVMPVTPTSIIKTEESPKSSSLDMLKKQAKILGITHSNNISEETLAEKINERLKSTMNAPVRPMGPPPAPEEETPESQVPAAVRAYTNAPEGPSPVPDLARRLTRHEMKQNVRRTLQAEYTQLVRVRLLNMNPAKADLKGEEISVSNNFLGRITRYVPFNDGCGPDGWHVEKFILEAIKEKKYTKVVVNAKKTPTAFDVPEYSIEILPPLNQKQLEKLAQRQAMAAGSSADEG